MSDQSLRDAIAETISQWCLENGEFPVAWISVVDLSGKEHPDVSQMNDQPTHRSLGLSAYVDEWFRDDARNTWKGLWATQEDFDD